MACAHGASSDKEIWILYFFFFIFFLKKLFTLPLNFILGLPSESLNISMFFKLIPLLMPVPRALVKASLAANLLA